MGTTTEGKLRALIKQLRNFNQIDTKMQVSTILTLLEVALAEETRQDIAVQDIERYVGLKSGTASRNVRYWSDEGHSDMPNSGYDLVSVVLSLEDRRRRDIKLTSKGKAFINNL